MKLEELSQAMKDCAAIIDDFCSSSENKSALEFAEEYIKNKGLGYIRNEILLAVHAGFIIGIRQQKIGKFKEFEEGESK